VPCHIYLLQRQFYADLIELHVFRDTEEVVGQPRPGYKVVAWVEKDTAGNWPRWAQEAVECRAARRRAGAPRERVCEEDGLYKGPALLYRAEQACRFNFTGVAAPVKTSWWPQKDTSSFLRSPWCCGVSRVSARWC
jgi:hypothetical protein